MATLKDFLGGTAFTVGGPVFRNPSKTNFAPRASLALFPFRSARPCCAPAQACSSTCSARGKSRLRRARSSVLQVCLTSPRSRTCLWPGNAAPDSQLDMLDYYLQQPYSAQFQFLVQQEVTGTQSFR